MKVLPLALLKTFLTQESHPRCIEKGLTSASITSFFFLGCLVGAYASDPILVSYSKELFTPVFTVFSLCIAALCYWHFALCEYFCFRYEIEEELADVLQETIMTSERRGHRRNSTHELLGIMMDVMEEVESEREETPNSTTEEESKSDVTIRR